MKFWKRFRGCFVFQSPRINENGGKHGGLQCQLFSLLSRRAAFVYCTKNLVATQKLYRKQVDFTFGLPDYVRFIEEFVISKFVIASFYSIHFTVTLAGT